MSEELKVYLLKEVINTCNPTGILIAVSLINYILPMCKEWASAQINYGCKIAFHIMTKTKILIHDWKILTRIVP